MDTTTVRNYATSGRLGLDYNPDNHALILYLDSKNQGHIVTNSDLESKNINDSQLLLSDGDLGALALSLKTGITYFSLSAATATGLPSGEPKWTFGHGIMLVRKRGEDAKIILHSLMTAEVAINTCNNGIWGGWTVK